MKQKIIYLVLLIALIFPTFKFFLGNSMYTFNDETQIANLHEYFKAFENGQFPPRWAPDMHYEFGSPFLSFNYQLPYYFGFLGHLVGLPLTTVFKLLMALSVIVGALGMYFLGEAIVGIPFLSLFAAVLYSYTPYQAIDRFVRGALGEAFALALLPWILLAGYKVKIKTLGVLFALLIISHQPAALFTIPLFFLIFFNRKHLLSYTKALGLGLVLSAYYWIPVILEKGYIQTGSPFNYLTQFPFIKQLIYSPWTYSGANPFSADTFSFQIGVVNLALLAIATIFALIKKNRLLRLSVVATYLVIFLMNIRSAFIWKMFPLLQLVQFPWRLLMFTAVLTPFLYLLIVAKNKSKLIIPLTTVLLGLTLYINYTYFRPGTVVSHDDSYYLHRYFAREALKPGESISSEYKNYAEDYAPLPVKAIRPKSLPAQKLTAAYPSTKITASESGPFDFRAKVDNLTPDKITFNTFYYPGWKAEIDGYPGKIEVNETGAMVVKLDAGKHTLEFVFKDTPLRTLSNIISLIGLIFIIFYPTYNLSKRHAAARTRS